MASEHLAAIRARADAASPGPWHWVRDDTNEPIDLAAAESGDRISTSLDDELPLMSLRTVAKTGDPPRPDWIIAYVETDSLTIDHATLLAHAPTDIRVLLDEVERLTRVVADILAACDANRDVWHGATDQALLDFRGQIRSIIANS